MNRSPLTRALLATVGCAATLVVAAPAHADPHPTHPGLVSADPSNTTPNVLDGHVNAFAQVGDTMVVGGDFSQVEQGGVVHDRDNVFAFSVSTGAVLDDFAASANGEVHDLQVTADQSGVVLAGAFFKVNGVPHTSHLAEVSITDGELVPSFTSPEPNGLVRDIVAASGHYYVAGAFTELGGHPRDYLAALDPDGSDSNTAELDFDGVNASGSTNVRSIDVSPDGSRLVVAGNFASVDGQTRGQLALLDTGAGATTLDPWSTDRFAPSCGSHFDAYMRDVAFSPSGDFFVVVTTGGPMGYQKSGLLCDSASRWDVDAGSAAEPAWVAYTGGDTLTAAIVDDNAVYLGGHLRWLNNSFGHNDPRMGAVAREGIAAVDPQNGLPLSWDPGRRRGYGVYGFALTPDGLWVGSDTIGFGGELRNRIAFCPVVGGQPLPAYDSAAVPGRLALVRPAGLSVRSFDGHVVGGPGTVVGGQSWTGLLGAFVVDQTLYAAWADGTMTAHAFDGESVGAATAVELAGGFRDLGRVRALFFDPRLHRVYYTLAGSDHLYYRYFQPESRTVGSWRYEAPGTSAVDFRHVSDAFAVGKRLYVTDSATGNLQRVGWRPASSTVTGAPVDVVGPSIDGRDYAAAPLIALR